MTPEIHLTLKSLAPHFAFSTSKEIDPFFQWDGEGPDPTTWNPPSYPHDVEFKVSVIFWGEKIEGVSYLGGSYFQTKEPVGDCGGYLLQKLEEALLDLQSKLPHDYSVYIAELNDALRWIKQELQKNYQKQVKFETHFGQSFCVRKGSENIKDIFCEITGMDPNDKNLEVPDLFISTDEDCSDGLYWTSWEECLMQYAVNIWKLSPNLLVEANLLLPRTDTYKMDLMDCIGGSVVKHFGENFATRLFAQLAFQLGKQILKPGFVHRITQIQAGLSRLLRCNSDTESINLIEVSADALEDGNHHDRTKALRIVQEMSDSQLKQFIKEY